MSLNLHNIVRSAINYNKQDTDLILYRASELIFEKGIKTQQYEKINIKGSWQSENDSTLNFADMSGKNTTTRKLYIYAENDSEKRPWTLYRPLSRGGDFVQDMDGNFWSVIAVIEDFSDCGWECLRCTLYQGAKLNLNIKGD